MTDYEYDENLPYVVESRHTRGLIGRFAARDYVDDALSPEGVRIIDTTPKPRVPADAKFVTWIDSSDERHVARYWGGESRKWAEIGSLVALPLEDLPGVTPDTVFTVLEERSNT